MVLQKFMTSRYDIKGRMQPLKTIRSKPLRVPLTKTEKPFYKEFHEPHPFVSIENCRDFSLYKSLVAFSMKNWVAGVEPALGYNIWYLSLFVLLKKNH